eukprot:g274.t1
MTSLGFEACFSNLDDASLMFGDLNTKDISDLDCVTNQIKKDEGPPTKVQTPMKATSFDPTKHMSSTTNLVMSPRQRAALMTASTSNNLPPPPPRSAPSSATKRQVIPKTSTPKSSRIRQDVTDFRWTKEEVTIFRSTIAMSGKSVVDDKHELIPEVLSELQRKIPSKTATALKSFHSSMYLMTKILMRTYGFLDDKVVYNKKKKLSLRLTPKDKATKNFVNQSGLNPNWELVLKSTKTVKGLVKHLRRKFKLSNKSPLRLSLLRKDLQYFACEFDTEWDTPSSKYTVGEVYEKLNSPKDFELQYTIATNVSQIDLDHGVYNVVGRLDAVAGRALASSRENVVTPPLSNPSEQKVSPPMIKSRKRERDEDVVAVAKKKKKLNVVAVKKPRRVQLQQISSNLGVIQGNSYFQRHSRDFVPNLPKDVTEVVTQKAQGVFSGKSVFAAAIRSGGSSCSSSDGDEDEEEEILDRGVITTT